jgi:hypothetical protein
MIGKDKVRINVTISKADKEKLEKIADSQSRSLSNLINVLIKECIDKNYK